MTISATATTTATLSCPHCAAAVHTDTLDVERDIGTCEACGIVFRIERQLGVPRTGARVARPASVTVVGEVAPRAAGAYRSTERPAGDLTVSLRWVEKPLRVAVFAFGVVAFVLLWSWLATDGVLPFLFFVPHMLGGVIAVYVAAAYILNGSRLVVGPRTLRVVHGPVPWGPAREIERARIRQIFVRVRIHSSKRGAWPSYALCADVDGQTVSLVTSIGTPDPALDLEQVLEDHLAIIDDPARRE